VKIASGRRDTGPKSWRASGGHPEGIRRVFGGGPAFIRLRSGEGTRDW
jgi:hypothetical protein